MITIEVIREGVSDCTLKLLNLPLIGQTIKEISAVSKHTIISPSTAPLHEVLSLR
jgi:hypothetical protein